MPDLKVHAHVRVNMTIEGRVTYVGGDTVDVQVAGHQREVEGIPARFVTSLEPATIGDLIECSDRLEALPVGAVVVPSNLGQAIGEKCADGWFLANGTSIHKTGPTLPATLVALRGTGAA